MGCAFETARPGKQCVINSHNNSNNTIISNNNNNHSVNNAAYKPSGEPANSSDEEEDTFHRQHNNRKVLGKDAASHKQHKWRKLAQQTKRQQEHGLNNVKVAACNLIANANNAKKAQACKCAEEDKAEEQQLTASVRNKDINSNWQRHTDADVDADEGEEEAEECAKRVQSTSTACARSKLPAACSNCQQLASCNCRATATSSKSNTCGHQQQQAHARNAPATQHVASNGQCQAAGTRSVAVHSSTTTGHSQHYRMSALLAQARSALTAQLASVGSSLRENMSFYATAVHAQEKLRRKQLIKQQHLQQRAQQRSPMHMNCCHKQQAMQRQTNCQHETPTHQYQQQQQQHQHHSQQQRAAAAAAATAAAAAAYSTKCSDNCTGTSSCSASAAAFNYIGHNYYHLLRNSISFYAASSVILVLCYLTTTTSAAAANAPEAASLDKHPIHGIDWSKFDESSSDKEILDLLLEKKRYDKRLLPPVNDEDFCCGLSSPDMAQIENTRRPHNRGTLTVNVNVLLLSLASPDESSLKYEVEFLLNQQWNDPRLQYGNKSHYDFLNALHHHDSIWTPDTYFIMHGDFKDPIIPMHFALRIYRNGTITYAMRRHLILSCQGSLHIFPFDDPKCSFSMESISYEEAQIKYVWKNDEDTLRKSPSLTTLNAYLIKNQTTACDQNSWRGNYSCLRVDLIFTRDRAFYFTTVFIPGIILVTSSFITFWLEWNAVPARSMIGNYSCLQVELTFTRDRAYYFTTVFIPGIILVTSSFITFWLEWNAVPARVMIGVTTMLNFFTTSNGFRSTLPVVSNLTAMNVWDGVCMCFIYASLLEFVCVNYMGRKRPQHNAVYRPGENPVTQRLPAVLSRIGVILASPLAAAGTVSTTTASTPISPTPSMPASARIRWEEQHGGIIGAAMQNLRARSIKRRPAASTATSETPPQALQHTEPIYTEPVFPQPSTVAASASTRQIETTVTVEEEPTETLMPVPVKGRSRSISTNTPPLLMVAQQTRAETQQQTEAAPQSAADEVEETQASKFVAIKAEEGDLPVKPPRKKSSRSTSPAGVYEPMLQGGVGGVDFSAISTEIGEKRREAGAPNEIVACTTCGGSSSNPCTHSANNGCATETCFVQVRKKEPPHPIRIAKTIDVIARITFPTAYAIFLIFFFVHYKGFS